MYLQCSLLTTTAHCVVPPPTALSASAAKHRHHLHHQHQYLPAPAPTAAPSSFSHALSSSPVIIHRSPSTSDHSLIRLPYSSSVRQRPPKPLRSTHQPRLHTYRPPPRFSILARTSPYGAHFTSILSFFSTLTSHSSYPLVPS